METEFIIKPPKGFSLGIKEIWQYRELFYFFTWRDIKVKYKQAVLGFLWAVLQPLLTMLIFTFFFGTMLNVPSDGLPYAVFAYAGLMVWNIFSSGFSSAGNSMVANANIIKKIYFPRLIIPMSAVLVALFDFFMAFIPFIGLIIFYQVEISLLRLLIFLPCSLLLTVIVTFGVGTFISALNVKYRDFRYIIPFMTQFLMFLTPVIYPVSIIKYDWAKYLIAANPMSGAVDLARIALLPDRTIDPLLITISIVSALLLFLLGVWYFRKTEAYFADIA